MSNGSVFVKNIGSKAIKFSIDGRRIAPGEKLEIDLRDPVAKAALSNPSLMVLSDVVKQDPEPAPELTPEVVEEPAEESAPDPEPVEEAVMETVDEEETAPTPKKRTSTRSKES